MLKLAIDLGGCISKYPQQFKELLLKFNSKEIFIITDMHDHTEVLKILEDNGFGFIPPENVHCANYKEHGEFCKAILLKKLNIDFFIDDFVGYVQWDSSLGPAPIRLLVAPDGFKPYWHQDWKVKDGEDFGRRVTSLESLK